MIMKIQDVLSPHFCESKKALTPLIQVAYDSDFCQDVVARGLLTADQMRHACDSYRLGKSKSGKCIFWMMDELGIVRDGHLADTWVSQLLKVREPQLLQSWTPTSCLFGQHLLTNTNLTNPTNLYSCHSSNSCSTKNKPVCVVESEASAVILSELLPESLWMAYADNTFLYPEFLAPLQSRTVTIYPRTDSTRSAYLFFLEYATLVRRIYPGIDISVDTTLEDHATDKQKACNIDLVDFIFDSHTNCTNPTDD